MWNPQTMNDTSTDTNQQAAVSVPATALAVQTYLPAPAEQRSGIALCLSGGGFRAALFHLGAVRRMNELAVLSQITAISSVSGGSILAAHLATHLRPWPAGSEVVPGWEEKIAHPFRSF